MVYDRRCQLALRHIGGKDFRHHNGVWRMDFGPLAWSLAYQMERNAYQLGSARFMYMDDGEHMKWHCIPATWVSDEL